jgi:hypothetical protein
LKQSHPMMDWFIVEGLFVAEKTPFFE